MLGLSYSGLAFLVASAVAPHLPEAPSKLPPPSCPTGAAAVVRVLATTDVHGHIRGWDYYANRADAERGLSRAATIVDSVRAADPGGVILVDAGDLLQGTPLTYLSARILRNGSNPVIAAMNAMRYDAAVIGNHEFNYGVPYLDSAIAAAHFPVLAANVTNASHTQAYTPFTMVTRNGVRIGIVGATTPGSNLWDASNLAKRSLRVGDIIPAVRAAVLEARAHGADAIVVVLHSGLDGPSSYDTAGTGIASENVAALVASDIPAINVVVYGHTHRQNPGQLIGNTLLVQPKNWATSVAVATIPFTCGADHHWTSSAASGQVIQSVGHPEDPAVVSAVQPAHLATLAYVNSAIGTTGDLWRADSARIRPTALTQLILDVERHTTGADIASTAAFDLRAHLGPGEITVAELAQLYPYDNTLVAVRISGAQLRAYLEQSSRYYTTSASRELIPDRSVAGYNFDVVGGVEYTLDVSRPVGQRVVALRYHGKPVAPSDSFTLALNNYRQSGGGGYSMLRGAPVVYDKQQEIRQLIIDEVRRKHELRKADYKASNWSFVKAGAPH